MIGSPDYEHQSSLSIRLQASDRSGLSVSQPFVIDVLDANDAPSEIVASTLFINSNAPPRSTVADLTTLDQDPMTAIPSRSSILLDNNRFLYLGAS